MKKVINVLKIIIFVALVIGLFVGIAMYVSNNVYEEKKYEMDEQIDTLDTYSMNNFCKENAEAVFDALKNKDDSKLEELLISSDGEDSLLDFADWSKADFENAVSMGSGSLTTEPDEEGCIDVSERFFVNVGKTKYVLFIETVCSRWGRENDGVSAICATTFKHFDATDYAWNGEKDDQSVLVGELFWNK